MSRRFINILFSMTLVLSGWQGAFAACPHEHCLTAPVAETPAPSHHEATQAESHCAEMGEMTQSPQHATEHVAIASSKARAEQIASVALVETSCAHCVGRSQVPATVITEGAANNPNTNESLNASRVAVTVAFPANPFAKEIIPAADSPPPSVSRHVLISVFQI